MSLVRYLVARILFGIALVFLLSSLALVLTRLAPGDFTSELVGSGLTADAFARERARYGLDRPIAEQYREWLGRAVRFDLGTSFRFNRPVTSLVVERAWNTAVLALTALAIATLVGVPLGVVTGSQRARWLAGPARVASGVGVSLPSLLLALVLAWIAARTGWFPVGGMGAGIHTSVLTRARELVWHLALPATALALPIAATLERLQSQAMAETLQSHHILAARARGVPVRRLIWVHGLRMAIRPVLAVYGIVIGTLLSGSFAVEIVMSWPGLGQLMYDALVARDIYLVSGCAAAGAVFLAAGSACSDVLLALADPRVREAG